MKLHINFKKVKLSEPLMEYTEEKITRELEKFRNQIDLAEIIITQIGKEYVATCHMKGSSNSSFHTEGRGDETHHAVDNMIKKIQSVLRKKKERSSQHREHHPKEGNSGDIPVDDHYEDSDFVSIDSEELIQYEKNRKKKSS